MRHVDAHIHIERGSYTKEWIEKFINTAENQGIDEIWLLEHCYRFREFVPMYDSICAYSDYVAAWFYRKAGVLSISDYIKFITEMRSFDCEINIRFGLEICYIKEYEDLVRALIEGLELDFLVGSVHFIDNFAFDHKPEHWAGVNVDNAFQRYFETSADLVNSGLFDGIAHPNSIKLFGHRPSFPLAPHYDELAGELAKNNMYAEMNSGCYRRCGCELGMDIDMIKAMKRHNVIVLTASDAHGPEDVGASINMMEKILDEART